MKNHLPSFYGISFHELKTLLVNNNFSPAHAKTLFQHYYKNLPWNNENHQVYDFIQTQFNFHLPEIVKVQSSEDSTTKFLMKLIDGKTVETVLIPFHKKFSVCLSSQVGCAMKCSFCNTGKMGLDRHLSTEEIVGQYLVAFQYLKNQEQTKPMLPNIVFMGQGEPLHNFEHVKKAIEILLQSEGMHLGPRQMTLSTAGYLPGIKRLKDFPRINIALSLHSPFNDVRKELIPLSNVYPLEELFTALDDIPLMKRQFITYEYLLIQDFNNRDEDVAKLAELFKNRKAIMNIIPFNPYPGSKFNRPTNDEVLVFKEKCAQNSIRAMIRSTKGSDILAACGQLNSLNV